MQQKQYSNSNNLNESQLKNMANAIRALSMDAVQKANSGHPGMPLGMADVATVLFSKHLKFDPKNPKWDDRDRFILSAGHGSMLLYSLLYLTGYEDITIDDIKNFRQLGAKTAGHPEYGYLEGIETTTGPLGQGLANSVGFALAEEMLASRFDGLVNHHTYVVSGDGCLMEGISQEAISLAGHLKLNKLIVLWDDNGISIDGPISLSSSEDQVARFKAACWNVIEIDGHNYNEIDEAISKAKQSDKPTMIACKTTIGYGAPTKAGKSSSHGSPLGDDEISGTRANIGWSHEPFVIPDDILNNWRSSASRCAEEYKSWVDKPKSEDYERIMSGTLPANTYDAIQAYKKKLTEEQPKWATRKSSGEILTMLSGVVPELVGGSADLTGSNLTKTGSQQPVNAEDYSGSYIYYGIREHAMAAAMNGMALHGGFIPYGGTFLIFTDYCRPAMRLSALMKQRVVYVMTHDSIGLGEDGPTHQPIEHMASLRAMPNIYSFRPADAVETLECWQIALESDSTPSVLALTRQGLPTVRTEYTEENLSARGGYILAEADSELQVTIFASGSEIEIALDAKVKLEAKSIGVRVVSMPCTELFDAQDKEYKYNILCNNSIKVAVEAAINYGWERYIGAHGIFVGMESFGESAPADELYKHFGITSERVIESVLNKLEK